MTLEQVKTIIRNVPDFPKPGIQFKDITTALNNAEVLHFVSDVLYEKYKDKGITKVVGIESRGFVFGSILAYRLGAGFVPMRKPGKLPASTYKLEYQLEYGSDCLEIHQDALDASDVVLLHDDLLATGGSASAAVNLIKQLRPQKIYVNFFVELEELAGRKRLAHVEDVCSLIKY